MRWNRVISALHTQRYYALILLTAALGIALSVVAFSGVRTGNATTVVQGALLGGDSV